VILFFQIHASTSMDLSLTIDNITKETPLIYEFKSVNLTICAIGDGTNDRNEQCDVMTYVELGQPAVLEIGELDQPTHNHALQGNH
jgi:hypothetical protein